MEQMVLIRIHVHSAYGKAYCSTVDFKMSSYAFEWTNDIFHKPAGTASFLIWRGSCINCSTDPPFSIENRRNQRRESHSLRHSQALIFKHKEACLCHVHFFYSKSRFYLIHFHHTQYGLRVSISCAASVRSISLMDPTCWSAPVHQISLYSFRPNTFL